jgi:hypothetical protein
MRWAVLRRVFLEFLLQLRFRLPSSVSCSSSGIRLIIVLAGTFITVLYFVLAILAHSGARASSGHVSITSISLQKVGRFVKVSFS